MANAPTKQGKLEKAEAKAERKLSAMRAKAERKIAKIRAEYDEEIAAIQSKLEAKRQKASRKLARHADDTTPAAAPSDGRARRPKRGEETEPSMARRPANALVAQAVRAPAKGRSSHR